MPNTIRPLIITLVASLSAFGIAPIFAQEKVPSQAYQWKNVQIVGGGFVTGIIFHPTSKGVAYARTDMGGGYRFDPATKHWIPITDFFTDYVDAGIESIAVDPQNPNRVYFAQGTATASWAPNGNLLRSDDKGDTWEKIVLPFKLGANDDGRSIGERLAVDPHDGNILFMGTRLNGLWKSTDRGNTWKQVAAFPAMISGRIGVGIVLFDGRAGAAGTPTQNLYVAVAQAGTPIYRSTDGGESWVPLPRQPATFIPHHMALAADGTLYVTYSNAPGPNGAADGAVWKCDTASGQWTEITPKKPKVAGEPGYGYAGLGMDASNPKTLVVSTLDRWTGGDQLWRTTDGGATWTELTKVSQRTDSVAPYFGNGVGHWIGDYKIDPFDPAHQMYVTGAGIWGTDDGTAVDKGGKIHWIARAQGLEECAILDLISPPKGAPLLSGMGDLGGFRHDDLTNSPASGTFKNPATSAVRRLDFAQINPDYVVRINSKGWDGKGALGAISTDNGATWTAFASAPKGARGSGDGLAVAADGSSIVWIPEGAPANVSTDNGATWNACTGLTPDVRWVVADRVNAMTVYAIDGKSAALYVSSNGGAGFQTVATAPGVGHLRATPGIAGDLWLPVPDKGLFHSTDGGKTFTPAPVVNSGQAIGFGKAAPGKTYPALYLTGTVSGVYGVFRSDDSGVNWVRLNDDQHHWGYLGFCITGDPRQYGRVYFGTNGRGIIYGDPAQK